MMLPTQMARELLLGLGTHEAMKLCYERAYSRSVGPKRKLRTLADVERQRVGGPSDGGDERYERRLRNRARKDEIAAAIALEFEQVLRRPEASTISDV